MTSALLRLRHDITAARNWIEDILDKRRLSVQELQGFDARADDIEEIIQKSRDHLRSRVNKDLILELSVTKLIKSWTRLCKSFCPNRIPVELLELPLSDTDRVSSQSSTASYTARFEYTEPSDARKYIPRLTRRYRAVIRAKVRHRTRRSVTSSAPPSLSTTRQEDVTLDISDPEPEVETFPWADVSDDELNIPDLDLSAGRTIRRSDLRTAQLDETQSNYSDDTSSLLSVSATSNLTDVFVQPSQQQVLKLLPTASSVSDSSIDSDSGIFHDTTPTCLPLAASSTVHSINNSIETADGLNDDSVSICQRDECNSNADNSKVTTKEVESFESVNEDDISDSCTKYVTSERIDDIHSSATTEEPKVLTQLPSLHTKEQFTPLLHPIRCSELLLARALVTQCQCSRDNVTKIPGKPSFVHPAEVYASPMSADATKSPLQLQSYPETVHIAYESCSALCNPRLQCPPEDTLSQSSLDSTKVMPPLTPDDTSETASKLEGDETDLTTRSKKSPNEFPSDPPSQPINDINVNSTVNELADTIDTLDQQTQSNIPKGQENSPTSSNSVEQKVIPSDQKCAPKTVMTTDTTTNQSTNDNSSENKSITAEQQPMGDELVETVLTLSHQSKHTVKTTTRTVDQQNLKSFKASDTPQSALHTNQEFESNSSDMEMKGTEGETKFVSTEKNAKNDIEIGQGNQQSVQQSKETPEAELTKNRTRSKDRSSSCSKYQDTASTDQLKRQASDEPSIDADSISPYCDGSTRYREGEIKTQETSHDEKTSSQLDNTILPATHENKQQQKTILTLEPTDAVSLQPSERPVLSNAYTSTSDTTSLLLQTVAVEQATEQKRSQQVKSDMNSTNSVKLLAPSELSYRRHGGEQVNDANDEQIAVFEQTIELTSTASLLNEVNQAEVQTNGADDYHSSKIKSKTTKVALLSGKVGKTAICNQNILAPADIPTNDTSTNWWLKALLLGLLLSAIFFFLWLILLPEDCDNKCYHCGVFGMRRRYDGIPPH